MRKLQQALQNFGHRFTRLGQHVYGSAFCNPAVASVLLVAVGVVCSGLAYLPFFTLVRDIGPSRTLTVGLAVPVLGVLWGWLLLDEAVTAGMLAGAALVVVALALVLRR